MQKVFNIFFIVLISIFFFTVYNYYSSKENREVKEFNRNNINKSIQEKVLNLPVLTNDTNNIIEFNNSISDKVNNDKPRSFWNLLKSK